VGWKDWRTIRNSTPTIPIVPSCGNSKQFFQRGILGGFTRGKKKNSSPRADSALVKPWMTKDPKA